MGARMGVIIMITRHHLTSHDCIIPPPCDAIVAVRSKCGSDRSSNPLGGRAQETETDRNSGLWRPDGATPVYAAMKMRNGGAICGIGRVLRVAIASSPSTLRVLLRSDLVFIM